MDFNGLNPTALHLMKFKWNLATHFKQWWYIGLFQHQWYSGIFLSLSEDIKTFLDSFFHSISLLLHFRQLIADCHCAIAISHIFFVFFKSAAACGSRWKVDFFSYFFKTTFQTTFLATSHFLGGLLVVNKKTLVKLLNSSYLVILPTTIGLQTVTLLLMI